MGTGASASPNFNQDKFFLLIVRLKKFQICDTMLEGNNYLKCPKVSILLLLSETNSLPISASINKSIFLHVHVKPYAFKSALR